MSKETLKIYGEVIDEKWIKKSSSKEVLEKILFLVREIEKEKRRADSILDFIDGCLV
jgi:uncharacterized membrane protein